MNNNENKVSIKGWLALAFLLVTFSGVFENSSSFLKAFDFQSLVGKFGVIADGLNFQGKGGTGAKEGFIFALTLLPTTMLALGLVTVAESLGALKAAEKIFMPILKPLMGIPGVTGLAFTSSFTSSDVASVLTKELYEKGLITDDQRTIFVAYQYAGSAVITNTIAAGAPLMPIALLPLGAILLLEILVKILGANIVRFVIRRKSSKSVNPSVEVK